MPSSTPTPRACIAALTPYASARRTGPAAADVWLNANEGEAWLGSLSLDPSSLNRYPEFQPPEVIAAFAEYAGLAPQQILVTRGADEGIDLAIRAFCEPSEDCILIAPPTYGMYAIAANTQGVEIVSYLRELGEQIDAARLIAQAKNSKAKVVFLCTPNNPSGETIPLATLETIAAALPQALVVIDEAYIEFASIASATSLLESFANIVILRTLSKAFGLAGIRVGFCLAQAATIGLLAKALAPYPISRPSAAIAEIALSASGVAKMRARVAAILQRRESISEQLRTCAGVLRVLASEANFVTFQVTNPDGLLAAARSAALAIRDFSKRQEMAGFVRVSIGSESECAAFAALISKGVSNV